MIDKEDFGVLDAVYVRKDDCRRDMEQTGATIHGLDSRLVGIETQQKFNNWLTALIAAGIVGLVIKAFLGG